MILEKVQKSFFSPHAEILLSASILTGALLEQDLSFLLLFLGPILVRVLVLRVDPVLLVLRAVILLVRNAGESRWRPADDGLARREPAARHNVPVLVELCVHQLDVLLSDSAVVRFPHRSVT